MGTETERILPQDLNAERALLGSMLIHPETIDAVAPVIPSADAFYLPVHQRLFSTLLAMRDAEQPIDLIVMVDWCRRNDVHGITDDYLVELSESFGDWTNAEFYARQVNEKYRRRQCIAIAERLLTCSYDPVSDIDDAAAESATNLDRTIESKQQTVWTASELLDGYPQEVAGKSATPPVPSHLSGYDAEYGGLARGSMIVLAARPSIGKSSLAMQWAVLAARAGFPALFVSVEMSRSMVNERLAAHLACKATSLLRTAGLDELTRVCQVAKKQLNGGHLAFVLKKNRIRDITAIVRSQVRKHKIALVVVDYLTLCKPTDRGERREQEVASMSAALKECAIENDVAMVVCAQLNRSVETTGQTPQLSHLRESGAIEQDADTVIFLHRDKVHGVEVDRLTRLIVGKQRNGKLIDFNLDFDNASYRLTTNFGSDGWRTAVPAYGLPVEGNGTAPGVLPAQRRPPIAADDPIPF